MSFIETDSSPTHKNQLQQVRDYKPAIETTIVETTVKTTVETTVKTVRWRSLHNKNLPSYSVSTEGTVKNIGRNSILKGRITKGKRYYYLKQLDGKITKHTIEQLMTVFDEPEVENSTEEKKYVVSEELKSIDETHEKIWVDLSFMNLSKYKISNHGDLMNKHTCTIVKGVDLGTIKRKSFNLSDNEGKPRQFKRYNLLMYSFRGFPGNNTITVDHINRIPSDDRLSNLRYATRTEQNLNRKKSTRRRRKIQQSRNGIVTAIFDNYNIAAKDVDGSENCIQTACKFKKSYKGFSWIYLDTVDLELEIWKDGNVMYPTLKPFEVSSFGRVRRKSGSTYGTPTEIGYMHISIECIDGSSMNTGVHRLIHAVFLGERHDDLQVNHIDGDKKNNTPENLEYSTQKENSQHAYDIGLNSSIKAVQKLTLEGEFIEEFMSQVEAFNKTGINRCNISSCCLGKIAQAGAFKWRFTDETERKDSIVKLKKISINQITEDETILRTFNSIKEAALILEVSSRTIRRACKSGKKTRKGFYLEYTNSEDGYRFNNRVMRVI